VPAFPAGAPLSNYSKNSKNIAAQWIRAAVQQIQVSKNPIQHGFFDIGYLLLLPALPCAKRFFEFFE